MNYIDLLTQEEKPILCRIITLLLFSMSTVDTDKLEAVVASLQNAISILPTGGTSIGEWVQNVVRQFGPYLLRAQEI